jgi:hypothetical protein
MIDGEADFVVFGCHAPAGDSPSKRYVPPLGLRRGARMTKAVAKGGAVAYDGVV